MGQRELFLALFGAARLTAGEIAVDGQVVDLGAPADAVAAGIGLVPEDRKTEGLFLPFTGTDNIALPSLDSMTGYGLVDRRREMQAVSGFLTQVKIAPDALTRPAEQFSGGNQQKMVIAKWLMTGCHVLLLYDPTRGVDIGTKAEIYRLIADFAASGGAVLFYSTDIGELVGLCGEVLVMYRGRICEVLRGDMVDEDHILRAALGQASAVAA
jgi:ribose transport system ATP-binding protein